MAIGTFGTFTQARLGIYAATKGLTVTGNNISNINTGGYTRQAVDQVSLRNGGADRYQGEVRIGNGALVRTVSQLRDPYLDIRYRTETSIVGYTNTMLENLTSIADILDEVGKGENKGDGILYAQFSDFLSSLQQLNTDAAAESNDTLARASADTLVNLFHFYADKLDNLEKNTADRLKQEIDGLNGVLSSIRDLNSAIRKSEIHGDPALELRDERNRQIDKLAEYVKIDVVYTMEDIGAGQQVEKLTIKLGNANSDPTVKTDSTVLIDGIYSRSFNMPETLPKANDQYDPNYKADPANPDPDNDIKQFKYLKADGTGTNEADKAEQLPNSNYDLTLGRLLDSKGRQWYNILGSSSARLTADEAQALGAPMKGIYSYEIISDPDRWAVGDKIDIAGTQYVVGPATADNPGIPLNVVKNSERLASFVASKISNDKFDVSAKGGKIIFTAKEPGAIDPADVPDLTLINGDGKVILGTRTEEITGSAGDPDMWNPSSITVNPDGTRTLTAYEMRGTDWYKTETNLEYSQEVDLDDNDLYGAIQAFRETLTEAGEFSTVDTIENVDESASIKRGIPYYRQSLDLLARVFANTFNEANNGFAVDQDGNYLDKKGETLLLAGEAIVKGKELTDTQKAALKDRALTDFLKQNMAGIDADGIILGKDGNPLLLGTEPLSAKKLTLNDNGTLADSMTGVTGVNADGDFVDADGNVVLTSDAIKTIKVIGGDRISDEQQAALDKQALDNFLTAEGDKMGGNLFSNRGDLDDSEGITAANISVSQSWASGDVHIVNTFTKLFGGDVQNTTQDDNISHMISLMGKGLIYDPSSLVPEAGSTHLFEGSFHEMLVSMCSTLGNDKREIETQLNTAATYQIEMDTSRDSVSAVDLNDEAMNMMQYAKSLNAAYRLMTTLDEALDRLINNTGVVGR